MKRWNELSPAEKRAVAQRAELVRIVHRAEQATAALQAGAIDGPGGAIDLAGETRMLIRKAASLFRSEA